MACRVGQVGRLGEGEGKQAMVFITNITSQTPWAYLGSMFANKRSDARVRHCKKKGSQGVSLVRIPNLAEGIFNSKTSIAGIL